MIFDIEDEEIEKCLGITNKLHRKRLRNGIHYLLLIQIKLSRDSFTQGLTAILWQ